MKTNDQPPTRLESKDSNSKSSNICIGTHAASLVRVVSPKKKGNNDYANCLIVEIIPANEQNKSLLKVIITTKQILLKSFYNSLI